jgi:hypothetical protein
MKRPMERTNISMQLTAWEWSMVVNALESYILKHSEDIDMTGLLEYLQYIEQRIGLDG